MLGTETEICTPTGIRTQDLVLIRHDTRYKLAALTAELWGRGHDIDGVEEADAAGTGGGQQRGSRLPQMTAASVVFLTAFRQVSPHAGTTLRCPLTSQEPPALPLAWSHESHSCTRISRGRTRTFA